MTQSKGEMVPVDPAEARRQQLEGRRAAQEHSAALADLKDEKVEGRRDRREARADRRERRALAKLNRQARISGARVRIAHDLTSSGEIRALRVVKVRKISLLVLLPVLLAFAAWSTLGVRAGIIKILGIDDSDPMWIGSWFVEPALIAVIAGIIIARAVLRSSGGDLDGRATAIEWGGLTVSLILNLAGAWPEAGFLAGLAATVVHSIGPVGTMVTAVLISVVDDGVNKAKPFDGAPSVADSVILVDESTHPDRLTDSPESTHRLDRVDSPESTHRLDRVDSPESTHETDSESVILTHRLDVESPDDESGESTHRKPSKSAAGGSSQKKPAKVIQANVESVPVDRKQLVFNTYDAAKGTGTTLSHAELAALTGVPKPTVTRYLSQRVDSRESTQS
jgi:hypothetical protein